MFLRLLVSVLLLVMVLPVRAHNLDFIKVDWIVNNHSGVNEYRLVVKTTLEYMNETSTGKDAHSLDLSQLTPVQAEQIVKNFNQIFKETKIIYDQNIERTIGSIFGISRQDLETYLSDRHHYVGYLEFYSTGYLPSKYQTMKLVFPEAIADKTEVYVSRLCDKQCEVLVKDLDSAEKKQILELRKESKSQVTSL